LYGNKEHRKELIHRSVQINNNIIEKEKRTILEDFATEEYD
jgi:hypothetical protein